MYVVMDLLFVIKHTEGAKGSTRNNRKRRKSSRSRIIFLSKQSHKATSVARIRGAVRNVVGLVEVVEVKLHVG